MLDLLVDVLAVVLLALAAVMTVQATRAKNFGMFLTLIGCAAALAVAVLAVSLRS